MWKIKIILNMMLCFFILMDKINGLSIINEVIIFFAIIEKNEKKFTWIKREMI